MQRYGRIHTPALRNPVPFAKGGVVSSPTIFPMRSGTGIMGEAGAEVIAPLRRNGAGELGVGAVAPVVNISVEHDGETSVSVQELEDRIIIRAKKALQADFNRSMATGRGGYARTLEQGYTARRRAT